MRRFLGAVLTGLVMLACSCSDSDVGDPQSACVSGTTIACTCASGLQGTTLCRDSKPTGCDCGSTPGEQDSGRDPVDACTKRSWWKDADGDGFGAGVPVEACAKPDGFVDSSNDCGPSEVSAFPGQRNFFEKPITGEGKPFDYDCDGIATSKWTEPVVNSDANCAADPCGPGTWADAPPACGVAGAWDLTCPGATTAECKASYMGAGKPLRAQRTQACR